MTLALMAVRQEVNNFESSVVVQELEFAMNLALYGLTSHLHNKRIKTAYYMECTVYKRTDSFRGVCLLLSDIAVCIVFCSIVRYNANLYCTTKQVGVAQW